MESRHCGACLPSLSFWPLRRAKNDVSCGKKHRRARWTADDVVKPKLGQRARIIDRQREIHTCIIPKSEVRRTCIINTVPVIIAAVDENLDSY